MTELPWRDPKWDKRRIGLNSSASLPGPPHPLQDVQALTGGNIVQADFEGFFYLSLYLKRKEPLRSRLTSKGGP